METKFTEQDSLKLINEMIAQSRDNIQKGAANNIIFAGYAVALTAILNIILIYTLPNSNQSFWIWMLMIPMAIVNFMIGKKRDKSAIVKTHIDKIVSKIWGGFLISTIIFLGIVFSSVYLFHTWTFAALITPVIMIMVGLAQYGTGVATRFKPFTNGAYVFWIGAVLCLLSYLVTNGGAWQFIILVAAMIIGFVIPGHILNRKAEKNV